MNKQSEINKAIRKSGKTKIFLANKCCLTPQGFNNKLKNPNTFTVEQAFVLCMELQVESNNIAKKIFCIGD